MVAPSNIVSVLLTKEHEERAQFHAKLAEIGGHSNVRKGDRQVELASDQEIGQLGQVGLHLYLYGDLKLYEMSREMQNRYPTSGDGGLDVPGLTIDVKTSLVRTELPLLKHRLAVRPKERHEGLVYILALLQQPYLHLMGWLADDQLGPVAESGVFKGAHVVPAQQLNPLPPWRYSWLSYGKVA